MKRNQTLDDVLRMAAAAAKAPRERLHPDDTLAHLGIDSLGRMRLVARLERRFDVVLGERSAQGAATPAALALAIRKAGREPEKEA